MQDLFTDLPRDILVIGVGSLGVRIAASGALNASSHDCSRNAEWAGIHTHTAELIASGLERKLAIEIGESAVAASTIRSELQRKDAELAAMLHGKSTVILIGALSEPLTALLLSQVAERARELSELNSNLCCIACDSLLLENNSAGTTATAAAQEIESQTDLFLCLSADALTSELGKECALAEYDSVLEQKIVSATETLLGAMSYCGPREAFSPHALRAALRGTGRVAVALGSARGSNAPMLALESALAHQLCSGEQTGSATACALMCGTEISMAQVKALLRRLTQEFGTAPLLGFSPAACAADEAVCLLMSRRAKSANVISIEAIASSASR